MQIVVNTPDRLILTCRPWGTSLVTLAFFLVFLWGCFRPDLADKGLLWACVAFTLAFAGVFWMTAQRTYLHLDRTRREGWISRHTLTGHFERRFAIDSLLGIEFGAVPANDGPSPVNTWLVFQDGEKLKRVPLIFGGLWFRNDPTPVRQAIADWLRAGA